MIVPNSSVVFPSSNLDHNLRDSFPLLSGFSSTRELEASPIYAELRAEIDRVLGGTVHESLREGSGSTHPYLRATAWNLERGLRLAGIIRVLQEHPELSQSDLIFATELDYGMTRTQNRFVARELAAALKMDYAFAPCYMNLNKGAGLEANSPGENTQALHGNALFSRFPMREAHSLALPNGKDKMKGREKRLGCQRAVLALVDHPLGTLRAISVHLDAHCTQGHRQHQMKLILEHLEGWNPSLPTLIGGDWNTSTYNSKNAAYSILGYARRVLMGVRHVLENHYPYPDRWFERHLFREIERRGYSYRDLNESGVCTLHYDVEDLSTNENMGEWIPDWCFWFIEWALKKQQGRCSMKLDWFAGKDVIPYPDHPPRVVNGLVDSEGALSDHDPIVLDFLVDGQRGEGY